MASDEKTSILVVDDMPDKLLTIRVVLEELGEEVVCVSSGREALRALLEREFAVILLDVNMPEMDGFETASLIRRRKRSEHTPIIFLTAYDDEQRRWQSYSLGAVDFLPTPVIPEVLRAKVAVFVDLFRKSEQIKRQAVQEVALAREQAARAAAEEANRRSTFLAEASSLLGQSLDYDATVATLLRIPVPFLCDATLLMLAGSSGEDRLVEFGELDKERFEEGSRSAADRSWRRQQKGIESLAPALIAALDESFRRNDSALVYQGPVFVPSCDRDERPQQSIVVPLVARGRTFGALCLINHHGTPPLPQENLVLAQELASRGGIALDNARLHRAIQEGNRRKDEFLAMLGHELRNPLGAISNALAVMALTAADGGAAAQQSLEIQNILQRQVRQMNRMIDDLLDVSRITRGKIQLRKEIVDLRTILDRAVATCQPSIAAHDHTLHVQSLAQPLVVYADAARIEQVVTNLLNNATKYSEPGGEIWLTAAGTAERVEVHVRDSGLGIAAELLHKVFDLFVQGERSLERSQGGLGIGLTLVRRLVEMHGGDVSVSSPGLRQGSVFSFGLPALPPSEQAHFDSRVKPAVGLGSNAEDDVGEVATEASRRMLVVEDNRDLAITFQKLLASAGHEVHLAHDGVVGLEAAQKLLPDVIFIDIGLPAMDGFAVARQLRTMALFRSTVLVAMTGYGQPEDRRKTRDAGFDYHLIKPVPMDELTRLLQSLAAPLQRIVEL